MNPTPGLPTPDPSIAALTSAVAALTTQVQALKKAQAQTTTPPPPPASSGTPHPQPQPVAAAPAPAAARADATATITDAANAGSSLTPSEVAFKSLIDAQATPHARADGLPTTSLAGQVALEDPSRAALLPAPGSSPLAEPTLPGAFDESLRSTAATLGASTGMSGGGHYITTVQGQLAALSQLVYLRDGFVPLGSFTLDALRAPLTGKPYRTDRPPALVVKPITSAESLRTALDLFLSAANMVLPSPLSSRLQQHVLMCRRLLGRHCRVPDILHYDSTVRLSYRLPGAELALEIQDALNTCLWPPGHYLIRSQSEI